MLCNVVNMMASGRQLDIAVNSHSRLAVPSHTTGSFSDSWLPGLQTFASVKLSDVLKSAALHRDEFRARPRLAILPSLRALLPPEILQKRILQQRFSQTILSRWLSDRHQNLITASKTGHPICVENDAWDRVSILLNTLGSTTSSRSSAS